jgi:hypothetical protein
MTQDGKSNPFFWQGFLKDFRFVSPLDRQRKRLFEEASLSHGVIKNITYVLNAFVVIDFFFELVGWKRAIWNFVVRIVFCIACSLFKLSLRQVVSVIH